VLGVLDVEALMRIAVISDTHGDLDSLRRVLTAIDRAATEQIWCLGDIVGLGASAPAEVADLVRDRCALALAGNHDRWVTGQLSLSMLPLPRRRAQLQWQHRVLSNEQLTWLAALRAQGRAHDIELWHGSRQDPITGWISRPQDAADHLACQQARIGLVGAHPPTVDRRAQRHDDRLRREPGRPRPRRRPSRSAKPRRRARITQMARTRPRSGKRDLAQPDRSVNPGAD
jgi:predicted phosphodiesterase